MKVAPSLQRLASTRQVKISNHTMIVPSQLPPKKKLPCIEEEEPEDMLLSRFAEELVFYLVSSSRFFLLLSMRLFIKLWSIFVKELISSSLFRRKLRTLDSICVTVSFGNVCLFRRYWTMFIVIDASV